MVYVTITIGVLWLLAAGMLLRDRDLRREPGGCFPFMLIAFGFSVVQMLGFWVWYGDGFAEIAVFLFPVFSILLPSIVGLQGEWARKPGTSEGYARGGVRLGAWLCVILAVPIYGIVLAIVYRTGGLN